MSLAMPLKAILRLFLLQSFLLKVFMDFKIEGKFCPKESIFDMVSYYQLIDVCF
jgi:hypothetical protein